MATTQGELWRLFYEEDPYEDFPVADHPEDTQGWGSTHPIFEKLIRETSPELIVEVGTWKGRSALHMARTAERLGLTSKIICIDTWLGAPEHILMPQYFGSLRMRHGYPQLFHTFMANVVRAELTTVITPLPQTSENGAVLLARRGLRPDLVYIDAAHEYKPVIRDLEAFWPLLAPGGMLFGDDYPNAGGVVRAAHEHADKNGLAVFAGGGKFVLTADPQGADFESIGMTRHETPDQLR